MMVALGFWMLSMILQSLEGSRCVGPKFYDLSLMEKSTFSQKFEVFYKFVQIASYNKTINVARRPYLLMKSRKSIYTY